MAKFRLLQFTNAYDDMWYSSGATASIIQRALHYITSIHYKMAIITFNTLKTSMPADLADLLHLTTSSPHTRSASLHLLQVGRRAFSHSSATIWNGLPSEHSSHFDSMELDTFKRHLKIHLFKKTFRSVEVSHRPVYAIKLVDIRHYDIWHYKNCVLLVLFILEQIYTVH